LYIWRCVMQRKLWLVAGLVVLLLLSSSVTALAQDGDGGKVIIGQSYVLPVGEELDGDLAVLGGSATLEENSTVRGNVLVAGGMLTASGTVRGDVAVFGGMAKLQETAVVQGDVAVFGGSLQRAPGAVVSGNVVEGFGLPGFVRPIVPEIPIVPQVAPTRGGPMDALGRFLLWELGTVGWGLFLALLGVVLLLMIPRSLEQVTDAVGREPLVSFGVGLLTLVVGALAGALLLIACGLGLLVWLATLLTWLLGWVAVGWWLGRRLLRGLKARQVSALWEVAIGVFLITLLARLPWCIGFLAGLLIGSIGVGAVVLTRFGTQPVEIRGGQAPGGGATGESVSPIEAPLVPAEPTAAAPES
jgi:hypothetical protein